MRGCTFSSPHSPGLQNVGGKKFLVQSVYRDKNRSQNQPNSFNKIVIEEKCQKFPKGPRRSGFCYRRSLESLAAKPSMQPASRWLWPGSLAIFMPKGTRLLSQDWFLYWDDDAVHADASVQDFKRWRRHPDDPLTTLFARYRPSGLVSESEREVCAGRHLIVPGQHQDKLV